METARDAWLKVRNEERLKRASRARNSPLAHFRHGDEVDFWRRSKGKGTRPHIKGRFHGGAVVLATSTEIDEEDGFRKLRKVIWPDDWRTWDKLEDCLGLTKAWMDGCVKDNMKTWRGMLAAWEHETRQVKRTSEMQPSSSSRVARPIDEVVLSQSIDKTHMQVEQPG